MYKNIKDLMQTGKVDEALITRGGARFMYNIYYFVKVRKNRINVYKGNTWQQGQYKKVPCAKLTNEYIMICPGSTKDRDGNIQKRQFDIWDIGGFLSLNLLYNGFTRFSRNWNIMSVKGREFIPFSNKMKFDWNGNVISKIPKWANQEYNKYKETDRSIKNISSRARYHDNKAIERYEAAGDNFDSIPISDVFKHRNSDRRRRLINHFGLNNVLKPYKQKVVNKAIVNTLPYELIQITIPLAWDDWRGSSRVVHSERVCTYLKMTNPTTGEYHLEGVATKDDQNNDHIADLTVKSALAWRDGENTRTPRWNNDTAAHDGGLSEYSYIEPTMLT